MLLYPSLKRSNTLERVYCNSAEDFFFITMPYMKISPSVMLLSGGETDCSRYCIAGWDPLIIIWSKGKKGYLWVKGEGTKYLDVYSLLPYVDNIINKISDKLNYDKDQFIGGFLGYIAYEYKNIVESCLNQRSKDDICLPDIFWIYPSKVLVFDKKDFCLNIYIWGFDNTYDNSINFDFKVHHDLLSDRFDFGLIKSNFSRQAYINAIRQIKYYIRHGDVYQINLSQRFKAEFKGDPLSLFFKLFLSKPAPFYAYINMGSSYIVSTSMERFLWSDGFIIETRPIKGTRPRGETVQEDLCYKQDLLNNPKDDAELSMIVDLLRNDLGKICRSGSVRVKEHKRIETYTYVHHLVTIIEGELNRYQDMFTQIINSTFPGGSITGCPKIRAMEIIDELEPNVRHVYTGSIGYIGVHHRMDLSIAIRTLIIQDNMSYYGAGGGIVYDSDPEAEYEETLNKAKVFFDIIGKKYVF